MSTWPIAPLTPADLDFAVVNYDFSGFTADQLQELSNDETIIDGLLADFAQSIADQTALSTVWESELDDAASVLTELANEDIESILIDLAGIAAAGDSFLNDALGMF